MSYNPAHHDRRSIRLPGYDYRQPGAYFVTLCTQRRACLLGEVVEEAVRLSAAGEIVAREWARTAEVRANVVIDAFVVMPNHVHGILGIVSDVAPSDDIDDVRATRRVAPPEDMHGVRATRRVAPTGPLAGSIGAIIGQIKSVSTKQINALRHTPGAAVWQRNYYEHIIRNEDSLQRIRQYILDNPARWAYDRENPAAREPEREDAWRD